MLNANSNWDVTPKKIALVAVFACFCAVGIWCTTPTSTSRSSTEPSVSEPTEEWNAHTIVFCYKENEVKADQDFKGRRLLVAGKIGKIGKDMLDTPYITMDEEEYGLRSVQAFFSNSDLPKLAELRPGQIVKVTGTCDGLMISVILKHSILKSVDQ